ncbi:CvfD/Ygs/GSP13 family RNA-binding post-transcriptional regulator [Pseudolactococcus raffinolactis]|jgi:general stress protein 13|uniref:S1 RNA-binding domain-containing protein n=1 Tax=Pseudolactococcus raffinolactis TaxID=1366 RepID=A0AAE6YMJ4_9LACT|nr:CvfD/Ygs/GSP13 family RNA-binding post-transcriptional regulator [Lactococcus raffinolactis]MBQ6144480.1 S1 RNA-binding domain-containing protein [Lactococcus sp.]MBR2541253.1 S1 RNA-binding domain-containing protein [Lactococcus sp.]MBW9299194.1 S1 RNA-binding domain-containing protein [Lactococcus raffinolactis]MBW9330322.1 S1 RNA-binding domain-containing protein [Lactococcus raffinolactis]MDN5472720.1 CvfD/Ygs/GSP13 family RNA-binding post-transcriptional regulator [Lactococcus raffinol
MTDKPIKIGDIIKAEITGLQKYGAFVKFGKHRGLIHISEIKSGYVADIHDVIEVGQTCQAQVIDVDEFNGKISLSLRTLEKHPQTHHVQRRFHFNNPANKIGFQPFKEQLTDWTKEQMIYLKGRKEDVTV